VELFPKVNALFRQQKSNMEEGRWDYLPVELQQEAWYWTGYPVVFRLREVCSAWKNAMDSRFWKEFNRRYFVTNRCFCVLTTTSGMDI